MNAQGTCGNYGPAIFKQAEKIKESACGSLMLAMTYFPE